VHSWFSYYVRQRWDGFRTQVHTIRCVWVPVAKSLHARHLRSPLPEAWSGQCLSVVGCPRACLTGGPDLYPGSMREARGADRWRNPIYRSTCREEKGWRESFPRLVLFSLVPPPPLLTGAVGPFPGMRCMVPQLFAAGGNRSYLEF
jgi:hypothetical protein